MSKTRTMYMHTLEGKPASFSEYRGEPYIHFVGGRTRVKLATSRQQIRREQARARDAARPSHWADADLYGYVLVEVPA